MVKYIPGGFYADFGFKRQSKGAEKRYHVHYARFLEGLNEYGRNEVGIVDVIRRKIRPCTGCFTCWYSEEQRCPQQDDMPGILNAVLAADLLIWSFPLYYYGMPSHCKAALDRMLPLVSMKMEPAKDGVTHVARHDFRRSGIS